MAEDRVQGIVTKLLPSKGFGFLRGDDGQSRFIPAASSPKFDELREGKSVTFVPVFEKTGKGNGLRAHEVEPFVKP